MRTFDNNSRLEPIKNIHYQEKKNKQFSDQYNFRIHTVNVNFQKQFFFSIIFLSVKSEI
jgi:hypothetical protein